MSPTPREEGEIRTTAQQLRDTLRRIEIEGETPALIARRDGQRRLIARLLADLRREAGARRIGPQLYPPAFLRGLADTLAAEIGDLLSEES